MTKIKPGDVITSRTCKAPIVVSWVTSKGGAVGYKLLKSGQPSKREVVVRPEAVTAVRLNLMESA